MRPDLLRKYAVLFVFAGTAGLFCAPAADHASDPWIIETATARFSNYRDLGDLLDLLPGIRMRNTGAYGQSMDFNIGPDNAQNAVILMDGVLLADPWQGIMNIRLIPVVMVERIEFFPDMNPFGIVSAGGAVNIVMKKSQSNRPVTLLDYRTGNPQLQELYASLTQSFGKKLDMALGAGTTQSGETPTGKAYKSQYLHTRISYAVCRRLKVSYHYIRGISETDYPYLFRIPWDSTGSIIQYVKHARTDHIFRAGGQFARRSLNLQLAHSRPGYEFPDNAGCLPKHTRFQLNVRDTLLTIPFFYGMHGSREQFTTPVSRFSRSTYGAFWMGTLSLPPYLQSRICFDLVRTGSHTAAFLKGLDVSRFAGPWQIGAGYSEGLQPAGAGTEAGLPFPACLPRSTDEYLARLDTSVILPGTNLAPLRRRTGYVSLSWHWGRFFHMRSRAYLTKIRNGLYYINREDGEYIPRNMLEKSLAGIEAVFQAGPFKGFEAAFTGNWCQAENQYGGTLADRPSLWGSGRASWSFWLFHGDLGIHLQAGMRFWSEYWSLDAISAAAPVLVPVDPAVVPDLKITLTVLRNAQISYAVDNITGGDVFQVPGLLLPAQTHRIGVLWNLYD